MGSETIWVSGKDKFRYNDDSKTYRFVSDDKDLLNITRDDEGNSVIVLFYHGTIRTNGDLYIHLDDNQDQHPSGTTKLKVLNGLDHEIFSVSERGEVEMNEHGITTLQQRSPTDAGSDDILTVGKRDANRGEVVIRNQPETPPDFAQPGKPGVLVLCDLAGHKHFLWVDTNNKLRISRSDPGAEEFSDELVGEQT